MCLKCVKGLLAILLYMALAATPARSALMTDIVFMIDATVSMDGEIAGVRNGFAQFVSDLDTAGVDARYAIVLYGGQPELIQDLTSDASATQTTLNNIIIGNNPGIHNNHNFNPEAGLEAIRMVLGAAPGSELANNNIPQDGILNFRSDARKNLILATDEDSDWPFHVANRQPGQTATEPPGNLNMAWQDEVDEAASAVIGAQAFINMLINPNDSPADEQYGDPAFDVSDPDLLNFDADATLTALLGAGLGNSLQGQVLDADLIARTFSVSGANDATFVQNFFAAKTQEIVTDPGPDPMPTPGSLAFVALGVAFLAARTRRRADRYAAA